MRSGDCSRAIPSSSSTSAEPQAELAARFDCRVMDANQAVVDGASQVVMAVPPREVLATIRGLRWREGQRLVCVAIDVDLACLRPAAPGVTVVRAMPQQLL